MSFMKDFLAFLNKHKVIGLAVAFIIGTAASKLVSSLVSDIIMPIIGVLLNATGGDWRQFVLEIGPIRLLFGSFLGALIDFLIIAFVVFLIVKYLLKEEGSQ
ncbi:MAG: large conductance mechanosensitive channel protein MscL [Candidatus Anstonellaceae archaeon]